MCGSEEEKHESVVVLISATATLLGWCKPQQTRPWQQGQPRWNISTKLFPLSTLLLLCAFLNAQFPKHP